MAADLPMLGSLAELELAVRSRRLLFVRYSEGFEADQGGRSLDTESGLQLPGLSVNPLTPESWWSRPLPEWLARQLCQYKELRDKNPARQAWVLTRTVVGRGPNCEPLLADVQPVARLADGLLDEAQRVYGRPAFLTLAVDASNVVAAEPAVVNDADDGTLWPPDAPCTAPGRNDLDRAPASGLWLSEPLRRLPLASSRV